MPIETENHIHDTPQNEATQRGEADHKEDCDDAIAGTLYKVEYTPTAKNRHEPLQFLTENKSSIVQQLGRGVESRQGIKWFLCMKIKYRKYKMNPDIQEDSTVRLYASTKYITTFDLLK